MNYTDINMRKSFKTRIVILGICMSIFQLLTLQLHASDRTISALNNETALLNTAGDLHLTSKTAPIVNSTIDIANPDAWVFFDNIKPSEVISNHLTDITINGATLVNGTNARVAIYAHGTVIMPHGSGYKPLTVFSGESFQGDSMTMKLHDYYNHLSDFDNAIKSFKLKRGYMATFATKADGTGFSRVFIADESDLLVDVMMDELNATASFVRVMKWQWVTKKGWCGGSHEAEMTNSTWFYDWQAYLESNGNAEYVPMRAKLNWSEWSRINTITNVSHMLSFNEPDHPEQHEKDNGGKVVTVEQALAQMPDHMKSGLRIGAPATTDFGWLYDFINKCDELNYRVDYVAVHAYWGSTAQSYYNTLKYVHERTGRPIWITEWNYGANWTSEWWPDDPSGYTNNNADYALNHISEIVHMFDTCQFIERYSIYNWVEDARAIVLNGALTKAGNYYANNNSAMAYNAKNEVIPTWNYLAPELSYSYSSTNKKITLSWEDGNGELANGYKVERKFSDGNFEELFSFDDSSVLTYSDSITETIMGAVSYRVSVKTKSGDYISSNEVSYYQSVRETDVEFGGFQASDANWSTAIFSDRFSSLPIVLLGVPSNNNRAIPLTQRINTISYTGFKFRINPWNYLNNPTISSAEDFSMMALPSGVYDLGSLKLQAKAATSIKSTWKNITFAEAFDVIPVLLCTQTSNYSSIPTSVSVRNVTTTGFEVRLMKEEGSEGVISSEKIHYVAVTPGEGIIGRKRFVAGYTENEVGDLYSPIEVPFDASYSKPGVFASTLSANDEAATGLKYYYSSANSVKIFKKRETSVTTTKVVKDVVGWMIVDMAEGQDVPDFVETNSLETFTVSPNPTADVINLNFSAPTHVEVYDLYGRNLIVAEVKTKLDLSSLPSGIYTIRVEGKKSVKVTKY